MLQALGKSLSQPDRAAQRQTLRDLACLAVMEKGHTKCGNPEPYAAWYHNGEIVCDLCGGLGGGERDR